MYAAGPLPGRRTDTVGGPRPRRYFDGRLLRAAGSPGRGPAWIRQDYPRTPVPARRNASWGALPLHHPVREQARTPIGSRAPWLVSRRPRHLRARSTGVEPRPQTAAEPRLRLRPGTWGNGSN